MQYGERYLLTVLFNILFPVTHEQVHLAPTQASFPSAMAKQMNETPAPEVKALEIAHETLMVKSRPVPAGTPIVKGYDFNKGRDLDGIMAAAMTTGFQVGGGGSCGGAGSSEIAWIQLMWELPETSLLLYWLYVPLVAQQANFLRCARMLSLIHI